MLYKQEEQFPDTTTTRGIFSPWDGPFGQAVREWIGVSTEWGRVSGGWGKYLTANPR